MYKLLYRYFDLYSIHIKSSNHWDICIVQLVRPHCEAGSGKHLPASHRGCDWQDLRLPMWIHQRGDRKRQRRLLGHHCFLAGRRGWWMNSSGRFGIRWPTNGKNWSIRFTLGVSGPKMRGAPRKTMAPAAGDSLQSFKQKIQKGVVWQAYPSLVGWTVFVVPSNWVATHRWQCLWALGCRALRHGWQARLSST